MNRQQELFTRMILVIFICIGLGLHLFAKFERSEYQLSQHLETSSPGAAWAQSIYFGPAVGLAADSNIISFISVFYELDQNQLNEREENLAYEYLYQYLILAQYHDPWFWDIYRLNIGVLGFQPKYTRKAIGLVEQGMGARNWDWQQPFFAGFLAHYLLNDDRLAFRLMKVAAERPRAPLQAASLAAKFLAGTEGKRNGIQFLLKMKELLPEQFHGYIDKRIERLEK